MNFLKQVARILITVLVPVILIILSVRILLTPVFIQAEYRMPGFPEDKYGFSMQERLRWSEVARQYLLNGEEIDYLGDLTFEDGSPLYNERELRHMLDVQIVVEAAMWVLWGSLAAVILAGIWARRGDWWRQYRQALSYGGWLTVGLIVLVITAIALNFNAFFVAFHKIFFEGDTWLFKYSDTLIRLFPIRFWQDAFVAVGGISMVAGIILGFFANYEQEVLGYVKN